MGVYIKGMEMPKSCYACIFFLQTNYWNEKNEADILSCCKMTGEKTWENVNSYLPNCPLIPVPPYGDLIDRDALISNHAIDQYDWSEAIDVEDIRNVPALISADEEDGMDSFIRIFKD